MVSKKTNSQNNSYGLKIPPQNIDAEKALLGSVMMKPDAIYEIMDIIHPRVFYVEKHRLVYEIILELVSKNEPVDLLTVSSKLKEKKILDSIGGSLYLTELFNYVPSATNVRKYGSMISEKFLLRKLLDAGEYINSLGYEEDGDVDELLNDAEKKVYEIANHSKNHKFVDLKEALGDAWERIDKLHKNKNELRGVPTGFNELDSKLSGLQNADLIILAARPSMGKTSLALDIARKSAISHKIPVCIFSLEMASQQLVDRMLAAESRVDAWKLRTGRLTAESDFERIRESLNTLSNAPIYIDDQPGNNIVKMRSVARRLKSEKNLGLIIVDYLQLMVPTETRSTDSVVQQVTEISRSLKNLARELNVPVLALSQLSRAVEQRGGRPRLSDLRDSGAIEQDADVVMFIHREDKYNEDSDKPNIAEILIEKHRNGPTGKAELYFDADKSTFVSLEKSDFGDFAETASSSTNSQIDNDGFANF